MKDSFNIAIAGATGYVGLELIKILSRHSKVKILYLCAKKSVGKKIYDFDRRIVKKDLPRISKIKKIEWNKVNILFTALPNGEAQKIAKILPSHVKLIDLSADFRLNDFKLYKKWYGINHNSKKLINKSIYAITEFSRKQLSIHNIISCPGCYPTSIQIPLIPLIKKKMINVKNIIIDAKSGITGAGKSNVTENLFSEINNSLRPYKIAKHKHLDEIEHCISKFSEKKKVNVSFTPHVIPINRGISTNIYLKLKKGKNINNVRNLFKKNNFTFLKLLETNKIPKINDVVGTNYCFFNIFQDRIKRRIILISVIDNLIKGAVGQAIQNMNLKYNFKEDEGLSFNPIFP